MPHLRRGIHALAILVFLLILPAIAVQAQHCNPGPCTYSVQVTPTTFVVPQWDPSANPVNHSAFFNVENTGTGNDVYALTCIVVGPFGCSVTPSQISLLAGLDQDVTVTYSTSTAGSGTVTFKAQTTSGQHTSQDQGSHVISVGYEAPVIGAVLNPRYRDVSKCAMSCFDMMYVNNSVGYVSMDETRSATLIYNSSTQKPTPIINVDVTHTAGRIAPTTYSIAVRKTSDNSLITMLNGATETYFGVSTQNPSRVTAAFDAQANGMATGAHPVTITITGYFTGGATVSSATSSVVVIKDQSQSVFGKGVDLAGYQRLYFTNGRWAVTEGDGSIADYGSGGTSVPPGTFATMSYLSGPQVYRRTYPDGSYTEFNSSGRMTKAVDMFGTATTISYFAVPNDTLISTITDPKAYTINLCYAQAVCSASGNGKLLTIKVLTGAGVQRVHTMTYSAVGRLIRIQDPDGLSDSLEYGTGGLLSAVYDRARKRGDVTYDAVNRIATLQGPSITLFDGTNVRPTTTITSAQAVAWQSGTSGTSIGSSKPALRGDTVRAVILNPANAKTLITMNAFGAPTKILDPYNMTITIGRDTDSRPTLVAPAGQQSMTLGYTGPNLTSQTQGSSTINFTYTNNQLYQVSGSVVPTEITYYNGADGGPARALKEIKIGTPLRRVELHFPDSFGRDTAVADSVGHRSHFTYDATWGNLWKTLDADGNQVAAHFTNRGLTDSVYAQPFGPTGVGYGTMNEVLQRRNPLGYLTQFSYDSVFNVTRVVDPNQWLSKFRYNAAGMLIARHDAADTTKADSMGYDAPGYLRRFKSRTGQTITTTYDQVGRVLTRSGPGIPTDTYRYDNTSRLWSVAENANAYDSIVVDNRGRLTYVRENLGSVFYITTYTYDALDRVTGRTFSQNSSAVNYISTMSYVYSTATGSLDSLCTNGKCVTLRRRGDLSIDTVVFNRGGTGPWKITQVRDSSHAIVQQDYSPSALTPFDITFTRDSLHRVIRRTSPSPGFTIRRFTYDASGQMVQGRDSTPPGGPIFLTPKWDYDAGQNRNLYPLDPLVYGPGNRLLNEATTTWTYDLEGNALCQGPLGNPCSGRQFTWDGLGRLTSVSNAGTTLATFSYDALGRRIRKSASGTAEWYAHEGSQIILDVDSATNAVKVEYAWYPGIDNLLGLKTAAVTAVALTDPNIGTIRGLAHFNGGNLIKRYAEDVWGDVVADTGLKVRFKFAGREFDQETGLYYMRARFYDPAIGRFLSEDPIGIAGGLNLYAYAGNDPVNSSDPFGLCPGQPFCRCTTDQGTGGFEAGDGSCRYIVFEIDPVTVTAHPDPESDLYCVLYGVQACTEAGFGQFINHAGFEEARARAAAAGRARARDRHTAVEASLTPRQWMCMGVLFALCYKTGDLFKQISRFEPVNLAEEAMLEEDGQFRLRVVRRTGGWNKFWRGFTTVLESPLFLCVSCELHMKMMHPRRPGGA